MVGNRTAGEVLPGNTPLDHFGKELHDIPAILQHITDKGRGHRSILRQTGEEDGLDLGIEAAIHIGNGLLIFKIVDITDAAKDETGAHLLTTTDGKAIID